MSRALAAVKEFLRLESAGGIALMLAAVLALIVSNTALPPPLYDQMFAVYLALGWGDWGINKPLILWINNLLMAVFFLLVGLEIKRELLAGELSSKAKASLPLIAAIGGMLGPIAVFLFFNGGNTETLSGWAIPAATDIAFALGILILIGARAPTEMKILLLAIAIIDDLGAITIIALFDTENLALTPLGFGAIAVTGLYALNQLKVRAIWPYMLVGAVLWYFVLKSGVHATLAGVVTAFFIPMGSEKSSPLVRLEHVLHPWVAFMILPIFAFANAGVPLAGLNLQALAAPLTLGIIGGLVIGKQVGVFGSIWLADRIGLAKRPEQISWLQLYGLACLTGVGFTMSLFIGGLAFSDAAILDQVRVGVIVGSTISATMGVAVLLIAGRNSITRKPADLATSTPAE